MAPSPKKKSVEKAMAHAIRQLEQLQREKLERLPLKQAADNGLEHLWEYFQQEMENCRKKVQKEMNERLSSVQLSIGAQLRTAKDNHATREKELLGHLEQAREQAKATEARLQGLLDKAQDRAKSAETNLQEQLRKERELLDQQAKSVENKLQEQLQKERVILDHVHTQAKATETQLQEQLRKEQEGKEQEIEGRLRLALEEEKARVHQELYNRFVEHFTKEKALLMEGMRKDIEEMEGNMKKEVKMKLQDVVTLDELELEGGGPMSRQESDCAVARD